MTAHIRWLSNLSRYDWASVAKVLPANEQADIARYRSPERQQHFVLSRFLLRRLLQDMRGCSFSEPVFARADSGRLLLADTTLGHISLSHAQNAIAVILASAPCGVDIEEPHPASFQALANRYFADAEKSFLNRFAEPDKATPFFRLWTLKEASVKALGVGLANHLSALSFDVSQTQPRQLSGPLLQLWQQEMPPFFLAAAVQQNTPVQWQLDTAQLPEKFRG